MAARRKAALGWRVSDARLERNLRLYPAYQACRNLVFWVPVFFLYFSERLPAAEVLQLEAFYYLSAVVLEVPSGYLSDRMGRRPTLLLAMLGWGGGAALIATSATFWPLALGQAFLAVGMAFNSGTDSALLYESLAGLDRAHEIGRREATALRGGLLAMSAAALVGGALATADLRWAYVLTAVTGGAALAVALRFTEPPRIGEAASAPLRQLARVLGKLRDPMLVWVLGVFVAMVVFQHVPYELFQPWLAVVLGDAAGWTPLVSGVVVSVTAAVAALATGAAPALMQRLGTWQAMVLLLFAQAGVLVGLGLWVAPAAVILLVVRTLPAAMLVPMNRATVHPRVETGIRATWLSAQSLLGRLAFAGWLALAARQVGDVSGLAAAELTSLLVSAAQAAAGVATVLLLAALALSRRSGDPPRSPRAA